MKTQIDRLHERHNRLDEHCSLFHKRFVNEDVSRDVHERHEHYQKVLAWLSRRDYSTQQNDFTRNCQPGTGQWFLKSLNFRQWLSTNTPDNTLFCPGIPGAGKTILSAVVISYLETLFKHDQSVGIAYVYCNFREQEDQNGESLLLSLTKQLTERSMDSGQEIPQEILSVYKDHVKCKKRPYVSKCRETLVAAAMHFSKTFVIVDALDECSEKARSELIHCLLGVQNEAKINLLVTSRFIPEIEEEFGRCSMIEISAREDDVQKYVQGRIHDLRRFVKRSKELQKCIQKKISKATRGMYVSISLL